MSDFGVVWFRNDLRVHDHAPLAAACAAGQPVLPLYIFDPDEWRQPERAGRQFAFLLESLSDLDSALRQRGSSLCLRIGKPADVLAALHLKHGISAIHVHTEPGPEAVLQRDQKVRSWALKAGISFREQTAPGATPTSRRPSNWDTLWGSSVRQPRIQAPAALTSHQASSEDWPLASDFGITNDECPSRQTGGRTAGVVLLRAFLSGKGREYGKRNLPLHRLVAASSGLSPHLTFGTLSIREVWQGAMLTRRSLEADGDMTFVSSLDSFAERLRQRCDLIQASHERQGSRSQHDESMPGRIHVSSGDPRLAAWIKGQTGFPLIDASMRCLRTTGQLDGRLRGLLLSFAACHLWMDPSEPARQLARLCTDYEPALFHELAHRHCIGTRNTPVRVPNPVRQSMSLDPEGHFLRTWVPEIAALPNNRIHTPWETPKADLANCGIILGQTYPMRIVDHVAAGREAQNRLQTGKPPRRRAPETPHKRKHPRPAPVSHSFKSSPQSSPMPVQLSFDLGAHA